MREMMKNAVIIGASGALGKEMVKTFYNKGYNVFAGYFSNENTLRDCAADLKVRVNRVSIERIDVTDSKSVENFFEKFKQVFGKIDVLINCAGVSHPNVLIDVNDNEVEREVRVNLLGVINVCRAALNLFSDAGGAVVNLASIWGSVGGAFETTYSATKGGVIAFSKALAKEIGSMRVRVNTISPGLVKSPMNSHLSREDYNSIRESSPLNRLATAKEVAALAYFLASPAAKSITGQNITIDAGFTL